MPTKERAAKMIDDFIKSELPRTVVNLSKKHDREPVQEWVGKLRGCIFEFDLGEQVTVEVEHNDVILVRKEATDD